jgi:hypothetical protein
MKAKWRWYELLLPGLREFAKGVQKMKTLVGYYKLIIVSIVIVVFLPLSAVWAYEWEWYTYATSDQSSDYYYSDWWVYKDVDITENACERNFDEEEGTGFGMSSDWKILITARVRNTPEEAYSNYFELEGEVYHYCEEDWEWSGPPASAPGATISFDLTAAGQQHTEGHLEIEDGTPYTGASSYIFCNAYSWAHDSQDDGYLEVDAALWGNVSDSSYSHDRYWDCTPEQDTPDGYNESGPYYYKVSFYEWGYDEDDEYEVAEGLATFSANGGAYGFADASVGLIAYEGDTAQVWSYDYVEISAESNFTMTSN